MTTSQCKCGHWRQQHTGTNGECRLGVTGKSKNPAGVTLRDRNCPCRSFRPSERSWWRRRILEGTEEWAG
jgi:hypothetical protein